MILFLLVICFCLMGTLGAALSATDKVPLGEFLSALGISSTYYDSSTRFEWDLLNNFYCPQTSSNKRVHCNTFNRVTAIRLAQQSFPQVFGSISTAWGFNRMSKLTFLAQLDLTGKNVFGSLPFSQVPNSLRELRIGGTNIGGTIPNWVWSQLDTFDGADTLLRGYLPENDQFAKLTTMSCNLSDGPDRWCCIDGTGSLGSQVAQACGLNATLCLDCATEPPTAAPTWAPTFSPTAAPTSAGDTRAPTAAPTSAPTAADPTVCRPTTALCLWATDLISFSDSYSGGASGSWGAAQVLGPPDCASSSLSDCAEAWTTLSADDGRHWIEVSFNSSSPLYAEAVVVVEPFAPGSLVLVEARFDTVSAPLSTVFSGTTATTPSELASLTGSRWLRVDFDQGRTQRPVAAIRVTLDTDLVANWNEIDAIRLVAHRCPVGACGPSPAPTTPAPTTPAPTFPPEFDGNCVLHSGSTGVRRNASAVNAPLVASVGPFDKLQSTISSLPFSVAVNGDLKLQEPRFNVVRQNMPLPVLDSAGLLVVPGGFVDARDYVWSTSVEIINPSASAIEGGVAVLSLPMAQKRVLTTAAGVGDYLLIHGGLQPNFSPYEASELFHIPSSGTASHRELPLDQHTSVHESCAVAVGQSVYMAGGRFITSSSNARRATDLVRVFDTAQSAALHQWRDLPESDRLSVARFDLGCAAVGAARNQALWAGGAVRAADGSLHASDAVDIFTPASGQWTRSRLLQPAVRVSVAAVRNFVFVTGGGHDVITQPDYVPVRDSYDYGGCLRVDRLSLNDMSWQAFSPILTDLPGRWADGRVIHPFRLALAVSDRFLAVLGGAEYADYDEANGDHLGLGGPAAAEVTNGTQLADFDASPVDVFDVETGQWHLNVVQHGSRSDYSAGVVGPHLIVAGGRGVGDRPLAPRTTITVLTFQTPSDEESTTAPGTDGLTQAGGGGGDTTTSSTDAVLPAGPTPVGAPATSAEPPTAQVVGTSGNTGGEGSGPGFMQNREPSGPAGLTQSFIPAAIGVSAAVLCLGIVAALFLLSRRGSSRRKPGAADHQLTSANQSIYSSGDGPLERRSSRSRVSRHGSRRSGMVGASGGSGAAHTLSESISTATASFSRYLIDPSEILREKKIGEGAFGLVFKGQWRNITVAIKEVKTGELVNDTKAIDDFREEALRMAALRPHLNCVTLYGITENPMMIITEFCGGGSLDSWLASPAGQAAPLNRLIRIIVDVARGIAHLHAEGIIHRDLAARNVLLDDAGRAKLTDFGMSRITAGADGDDDSANQTKTTTGPLKWMAPEALLHREYSKMTDMFSFGVVCYEILAKRIPWSGETNAGAVHRVLSGERMPLPKETPSDLAEIVRMCWSEQKLLRPTAARVCKALDGSHNSKGDGSAKPRSRGRSRHRSRVASVQLPGSTPTAAPALSMTASSAYEEPDEKTMGTTALAAARPHTGGSSTLHTTSEFYAPGPVPSPNPEGVYDEPTVVADSNTWKQRSDNRFSNMAQHNTSSGGAAAAGAASQVDHSLTNLPSLYASVPAARSSKRSSKRHSKSSKRQSRYSQSFSPLG